MEGVCATIYVRERARFLFSDELAVRVKRGQAKTAGLQVSPLGLSERGTGGGGGDVGDRGEDVGR